MVKLKILDSDFRDSLLNTYVQIEKTYKNIQKKYQFDLDTTDLSEAILERLKTYYITQRKVNDFLDKRYLAAASDFFVESVLFFLKLYLQSQGWILQAHSERQIKRTKKSIRPDISIWRGDEVIAIIECKTQLGWNRSIWEDQYRERSEKLKELYPKAQSFLLVMTGSNWWWFWDHVYLWKKYFCLLEDIWPKDYNWPEQILTPIEDLFKQLK